METAFREKLCDLHLDVQGESERICLSALAEGADTLAARAAPKEGYTVIAPLPLPPDVYRTDFKGQALAEFDDLLTKCPHFFVGYAPGCTSENTREYGHHRDLQYAFVGEYLTQHCQVLVAFWDGQPGDIGGTGDVVAMQQTGIPSRLLDLRRDGALLDAPEGGRAIQIYTRRKKHQAPAFDPSKIARAVELSQNPNAAAQSPEKEEAARKQLQTRREQRQAFVEAARSASTEDEFQQLPSQACADSPELQIIRDSFLRADALANERQKSVDRLFGLILGAAAAFIFLVGVAGAFEPQRFSGASLVLSWAFLALAWGISRHPQTVRLQNQRQDYRALAEAWRVCFFWRAVGIRTEIATAYLRYQRGELDWIRQLLGDHDLKARALNENRQATPHDFQTAYEGWVNNQSKYFHTRTVPRLRQKLTKLRNWSWFLLFAGLCAAAVGTVADLLAQDAFASRPVWSDLGLFARSFFSADRLASPFTPALLLLARMDSWKRVTEENTLAAPDGSKEKQKRLQQLHRWILRRNTRQRAMFIGVSVLALALASEFALKSDLASVLRPWLQVAETACFFAPALVFLYADINALPEHVESYERMASIFARAQKMLDDVAGITANSASNWSNWTDEKAQARARRIIEELGREALHENGEWLLIHRDRPLDIEA